RPRRQDLQSNCLGAVRTFNRQHIADQIGRRHHAPTLQAMIDAQLMPCEAGPSIFVARYAEETEHELYSCENQSLKHLCAAVNPIAQRPCRKEPAFHGAAIGFSDNLSARPPKESRRPTDALRLGRCAQKSRS